MKSFFKEHGADGVSKMWEKGYAKDVLSWYRLVHDFRTLNQQTLEEPFPLRLIPELLDEIEPGCDRISRADLPDSFVMIRIRSGG